MLAKYDYEKIADHISDDYVQNKGDINENIKITAIKMELNPEQIKRLTELTNIKTYNKLFDTLEDKTFKFELGDSKKIINDVYSDTNDTKTEIKDMPAVEYKSEMNPKRPEKKHEVLGDNNEIVVSKNTSNSEDAAGDRMSDALKIPRKDYSYSEGPITNEDSRGTSTTSSAEKEDEERRLRKSAAMSKAAELEKELENRCMLLEDQILDEVNKVASLFRGYDKNNKFGDFVKNAHALYAGTGHLTNALILIKDAANINERHLVPRGMPKIASKKAYGIKNLDGLIGLLETYTKTAKAKEVIEQSIKSNIE